MDWKDFSGQLSRSALGRLAFVGELYNVRTEAFSSRSLLKSSFPGEAIQLRDVAKMDYDYSFTESISDRLDLLKIEAELGVSFLCGLFQVEGSGKFLEEESKSQKTVSCSIVCKLQTATEKLFVPFCEIVEHLDLTALEDSQNTHVVVEVNWGANCVLTLEASFDSDATKRELEGMLKGELSGLRSFLQVRGSGGVAQERRQETGRQDVRVKVNADVIPEAEWPTTVEGFSEFVLEAPHRLKKLNDGKGKPLSYVMIPLSAIRKAAKLELETEVVVKAIDESFIHGIIHAFEEISRLRKRLSDFVHEVEEFGKYLRKEEPEEGRRHLEALQLQESAFKRLISENWVRVKSGEKSLQELLALVEDFKAVDLRLPDRKKYLDSCESIRRRVREARRYAAKGVVCLGRGERLEDFLAENLDSETVVLATAAEFKASEGDLFRNTVFHFLALAAQPRDTTRFLVLDSEFGPDFPPVRDGTAELLGVRMTGTRCLRLRGTKVLQADVYGEHLLEEGSNLARLKERHGVNYCQHRPPNRVALEMVCPGFRVRGCPSARVKWSCGRCKAQLEFGFDEFFYCACGKAPATGFEYRCGDPRHGPGHLGAEPEFLREMLYSLRPFKEMNVLVIGQSGVGKSTWINSVVNYLSYDSMEAAEEGGIIGTIPLTVTTYDSETYQKHTVDVGQKNSNELTTIGDSATQFPHTYKFVWQERSVRIIDTPGLGDTRGIHQDKENMRNIINHIGHFQELHGVCILLRANETRVTAAFSYCLKELLVHLHRKVAKNIVFCFTNARSSFYSPGQTALLLQKVISELGLSQELPLGKHNMFCLDNEAFLFLCARSGTPITYKQSLVRSFKDSWDISTEESIRLFETIKTFEPHKLEETLSLVTARSRILTLMKPIAEISKIIQMNVAAAERKKEEIERSDQTLGELLKNLVVDDVQLETEPLQHPRTVCTSPKCVTYLTYRNNGVREIDYSTHCHPHCGLRDIEPKMVNNPGLQGCTAMKGGYCTVCGCSWHTHMHITYSQKRVIKKGIDRSAQEDMRRTKTKKEAIQRLVAELEKKIAQYQAEMTLIIQTSVTFGMFLRENAITVYNDSLPLYLEYLIEEEENKLHKTEEEKQLIQQMKQTLAQYRAEAETLQKVVESKDVQVQKVTPEDISRLEKVLYSLELTGEQIRNTAESSRSGLKNQVQYSESMVHIRRRRAKKGARRDANDSQKTLQEKLFSLLRF